MFTVSKPSPDRLDIEITGALDADAMQAALDEIVAQSEGITDGKLLFTIQNFEMPTFGAFLTEMMHMPSLLSMIRKFDRCATLSDVGWLRTFAEFEGAVIPSLDVRSFALTQTATAEAWLEGQDDGEDEDDPENFPV